MANLLGLFLGVAIGLFLARRKGGNRMDMAHYAGVFGLIGLILGTLVGVFLLRG
ncbi:hypothetical protein [Alterinioella nitratireducens]|jgi:hypothetical protein|uniref:hypothetical protein n=1 Tax=Alterinioella nitratireducens TaxID=2735915 RepID=UPI001552DCC2|nr:hypothetical protein [Alterinioella nitratireducens]NPD18248.1 hypothetical protein [Alterinioella nitratireducens]|tara:strand:+ start:1303 stop:1464 length:162 start_codon:yes stop_codon:yes gene_type:complete